MGNFCYVNGRLKRALIEQLDVTSQKLNVIGVLTSPKAHKNFWSINVGQATLLNIWIITNQPVHLEFNLMGENANVNIQIVGIGRKQFNLEIKTEQNHLAAQTKSHLSYLSVLTDESQSNFEGLIKIEKEANSASAKQDNLNILLSSGAKANSRPVLQIYNNNVECFHGSATSDVNESNVLYLQKRGLSLAKAKEELVKAKIFETTKMFTLNRDVKIIEQIIKEQVGKLYEKV